MIKRVISIVCIIGLLGVMVAIISSSTLGSIKKRGKLNETQLNYLVENHRCSAFDYNISDTEKDYGTVHYKLGKNEGIFGPVFTIDKIKLIDSGLEDGMIYTMATALINDQTEEVLFIIDPEELDWVAISVMIDDENHLFTYYRSSDNTSIYDR